MPTATTSFPASGVIFPTVGPGPRRIRSAGARPSSVRGGHSRRRLDIGQPCRSRGTDPRAPDSRGLQLVRARLPARGVAAVRRLAGRYPAGPLVHPLPGPRASHRSRAARAARRGLGRSARGASRRRASRGRDRRGAHRRVLRSHRSTGLKDVDAGLLARASPLAHPVGLPVLIVHGSADTEAPVDQAERYCRRAATANGSCRLVEVKGGSHRSENWWPSQWAYKRELITWLSAQAPVPRGTHRPYRSHAAAEGHRV